MDRTVPDIERSFLVASYKATNVMYKYVQQPEGFNVFELPLCFPYMTKVVCFLFVRFSHEAQTVLQEGWIRNGFFRSPFK